MLAMQGGPLEWVSDHRYHHLHTEPALDPHSSYEGAATPPNTALHRLIPRLYPYVPGFYWSHLGWMLDAEVYEARCSDF